MSISQYKMTKLEVPTIGVSGKAWHVRQCGFHGKS